MTNLVNSEVKNLGLVELSDDQLMDINGGADNTNGAIQFLKALGNAVEKVGEAANKAATTIKETVVDAVKNAPAIQCTGSFSVSTKSSTSPDGSKSSSVDVKLPTCSLKPAGSK